MLDLAPSTDPSAIQDKNSDTAGEHADIVEILALVRARGISEMEFKRLLQRQAGPDLDDDIAEAAAADAFERLEQRGRRLKSAYPFVVSGNTVKRRTSFARSWPYRFMLTVQRHDMSSKYRRHRKLDPTRLFERLCRYSVAGFLCPDLTAEECSVVLGSTRRDEHTPGDFDSVLDTVLGGIGTTDTRRPGIRAPGGGDGGIDIVCWRRFADDRLPGAVTVFGQCKTGKGWHLDLHTLTIPSQFLARYTLGASDCPVPVSAFMVPACIESRSAHADYARRGQVYLFDRLRIAQFALRIPKSLAKDCDTWTTEALANAT